MTAKRTSSRPLRADAARNQARILDAAREVFSAKGLDVSLDEIAHHAGVGVATLYRRFPTRQSLVVELFELELQKTVVLATAALGASDPWEGFRTLLMSVFRSVAQDKGIRQALLSSRYGLGGDTPTKKELVRLFGLIIKRAQCDGDLRPDITVGDIPPLILMVSAVADFASHADPKLWERYSTLITDGLSKSSMSSLLMPAALSQSQMALASSLW